MTTDSPDPKKPRPSFDADRIADDIQSALDAALTAHRVDYSAGSEPLRPVLIWAAASTTIFVVLAATVYVVSCWGGR